MTLRLVDAPNVRDAAHETADGVVAFADLYDAHASFVFRVVLRLGVGRDAVEDVVQEIFLVVHRRLEEFEQRSKIRTWIYGIAVRVARTYRRTLARKHLNPENGREELESHVLADDATRAPDAVLEKAQAAELVVTILEELDDELREVFVLAELEEMTAIEMGEVLGVSANTVASRLRLARRDFDRALTRARARDEWRMR